MKRFLVIIAALILTISSVSTGYTVSAAEKVEKDISWFDYYNQKDSYKISTEAQLLGLASLVNEEQSNMWKPSRLETFEGVTFTLTRDIRLTQPWTPIGIDDAAYFAGTFDGNGFTISGMNVRYSYGHSGLFGYLPGEVKNLSVGGSNESKDSNSGGIVGTLSETGRVINCSSAVKVVGHDKCGGIVGNNEGGTVEGCINIGNISGTHKVGGVVGENWGGIVTESGNRGKVKSTRRGVATYGTGGVAGRSVAATAEILECYNIGEVNSNTEATGGVVGYTNAVGTTVKDCYNTGTININVKSSDKELSPAYVGGIVGIAGVNGVTIRNCYNAGMINNADYSGGIVGRYKNITEFEVSERYIRNNYYITMAFSSAIGHIDNPRDENLEKAYKGISAGNMHNLSTSLSVEYMKDTGAYGNNGFPVLRWQKPITEVEKQYFKDIPKELQNKLDKYLIDTADKEQYGQTIINVLSPHNTTTNAFILYMEAQDTIEEVKEKEAEQNE